MAKVALLMGVSQYEEGLSPLPSAEQDVAAMHQVLTDAEMGGFEVAQILTNPDPMVMQESIETFFSERSKNDLALLFFSGHGVKDDSGRLFFATPTTRKNHKGELIKATAVPASFIQDIMSDSRCKRQVVILDCCFSGAFAEGMTAKDDGLVDIQTQLGGEGRAVLTSSSSTQYSFEQSDSDLSVYTQYLVEGISTGAADSDNDGAVSIDELHEYASRKVQESAPAMKPKIYAVEEGFKIRLSRAPIGDPKLRYRQEAERYASRGNISVVGRQVLVALQENLDLTNDEVLAIESEVLKPYRDYQRKLQQYRQTLTHALEQENPLSERTRTELHDLQEILSLKDEDILPIEQELMPAVPAVGTASPSQQPVYTLEPKSALSNSQGTDEPKGAVAVVSAANHTLHRPFQKKWLIGGGILVVLLGLLGSQIFQPSPQPTGGAEYDTSKLEQELTDLTAKINRSPSVDDYYERGLVYTDLEQHQSAVGDFTRALKLNPNDTGALLARGDAYRDLKNFQAASQDYKVAAKLCQENGDQEGYQKAVASLDELARY